MDPFPLFDTPLGAPFFLPDGRPLQFGPITPAARPVIEKAMAGLSPQTSRRRFFTVRYKLSDRELDDMTRLDGINRFAVGASLLRADGDVEGVGVARYVRDTAEKQVADLALLVVDAFQGLGVGRTLLARLASAAFARGIRRFRGMVLTENQPMLRLLREFAPGLRMRRVDDYYDVEVPLAPTPALRSYAAGPLSSITLPSGSLM